MAMKTLLCCFIALKLLSICRGDPDPNTCVECARTPTACRRISGLYTVTVLTEGTYNPVVEIPAPACEINITEFAWSNNYIGIKTAGNKGIINSYWGLAQPGQYYGAGARFAYDRHSGSCKGSCIHSEGPTTENVVVQILYYEKNPGISYQFVLPNHIPFTPYEGTSTKRGATSASSSQPSSSSSSQNTRRLSSQRLYQRRYRNQQRTTGGDENSFGGEYNTGQQRVRSEGRPDTTSALEARIGVRHKSRSQAANQRSYDYNGSRYGVHTLGGKGLSYTAAAGTEQERPSNSGRVISRYRPRTNPVRQAPVPQYVSGARGSRTYPRASQYQGYSARAPYSRENAVEALEGGSYNSVSQPLPAGRGRSLGGGSSYRWKISGLTECSRTCGRGVQSTNVVCVSSNSRTQVVVTPENCANSRKPRSQTVECNTQPCEPAWEAEDWSACSVTCGSGTQTRTVECRQRFSPSLVLKVSADQCGLSDKPAVAQQCEEGLCSGWRTGQWGQCSKNCGGGQRTRSVYCVDRFATQIPSNYCTDAKPRASQSCNTNKCSSQWWISEWAKECSESCGEGLRRRDAVCMNDVGDVVNEGYCFEEELPLLEESCTSDVGCRGTWFAGPWEKCSTSCGEGTRQRQVACIQRDGSGMEIVASDNCEPSLRPESQESCTNSHCRAVWFASDWSQCSVTCGEGVRTRETRCLEDKRSSPNCVDSLKPTSREVCTTSPCADVQRSDRYVDRTQRQRQRAGRHRANQDSQNQKSDGNNYEEVNLGESRSPKESVSYKLEGKPEDEIVEDFDKQDNDEEENNTKETSDLLPLDVPGNCLDKHYACNLVAQSRLCSYKYYKTQCCHTCTKLKRSKGSVGG